MLPFDMTVPATVAQRSEIQEGLLNYPVNVPDVSVSVCLSLDKGKVVCS
jgi:hypothetical protein